jgi:WD40 repeat protein
MGGSYSRSTEKKAKEAALLAAPVPLHRHSVTCIKFCNGGDLVLTASEDRTLALWDFSQGQKFGKLWRLNKLTDPCSKPAEDLAAAHGHPASVGVLPPPPVSAQTVTEYSTSEKEVRQRRRSEPCLVGQVLRCPLPDHSSEGILPRSTSESTWLAHLLGSEMATLP